VALLVAAAALRRSSQRTMESTLLIAVTVMLPVAVLMFRQVRRGRWSNVDASDPSERPLLFGVALSSIAFALGWILVNDPRSFLIRGLLVVGVFLMVASILTRWVKLSLHVAFAALTTTALCLIGSPIGYALIPVVPVLFWSRIALARHRVHELVVGLLLGVMTGAVLVMI
jgi:ABC-type Fe3+ transport system permease subunit